MNRADATARAIAMGATVDQIERETLIQMRHVGTVPFRNMIHALSLPVSMLINDRTDWVRLAAALTARERQRSC